MEKKVILTGDRPTGKLHLGHYVGTLRNRVRLQEMDKYKQYIMIADQQALTDYAKSPKVIQESILEVALDYLSVGINPEKTTIFIQSQVPELSELTMYYMNLVTIPRLYRNPTVKSEISQKGIEQNLNAGFLLYPISQAADITAFNANLVPAGEDQEPVIEQAREIVRSFNSIYADVLVEPQIMLPENESCNRLPGIDGKSKMSKSLDNAIYLADDPDIIRKKVMGIYTDPNHIHVSDPGRVEDNVMFTYLDAFCEDRHFVKYLSNYTNLDELKDHYRRGGLGDVKVKIFLNNILQEELEPFRKKRKYWENKKDEVLGMLFEGSDVARGIAGDTLKKVRRAIGIDYTDLISVLSQ